MGKDDSKAAKGDAKATHPKKKMKKRKQRGITKGERHSTHPANSVGALLGRLREDRETLQLPRDTFTLPEDFVKSCCGPGVLPPEAVTVTTTCIMEVADEWVRRYILEESCPVLGFDIEWRPCRRKGQIPAVALVQVATAEAVLLLQTLWIDDPSTLRASQWAQVLASTAHRKVGVGILQDAVKLENSWQMAVLGRTDIVQLAQDREVLPITPHQTPGLKTLADAVLKVNMAKPKPVVMSDWATQRLTEAQMRYAAIDAWISRQIYVALEEGTWSDMPTAITGPGRQDNRSADTAHEAFRAANPKPQSEKQAEEEADEDADEISLLRIWEEQESNEPNERDATLYTEEEEEEERPAKKARKAAPRGPQQCNVAVGLPTAGSAVRPLPADPYPGSTQLSKPTRITWS